ncbi:hypothetical protein OCK74_14145 [Chitinophagaceae bacterium LB-8]|jgi:hypothetical protein|uniref:Outer membrane insertion C-signal n=1 Tax=Paraflavisolibacter caeni TaxID=2982496 RepID=A0A9X2XP90_9BACT|nr:hypothetical protein [Paraflavisolibacter caeni]MCU7550259.1 hypothetical protein [Paraflavisolibacter caeni]
MKKEGFILFTLLMMGFYVQAQDYKTAVGVRISSADATLNSGISFKHFFGSTALEALVTFGDPFAIGALLEKHKPTGPAGLTWFYGGGAYVGFGDNRYFGGQGVIGLDYKFQDVPINASLDWKPELNFVKEFSFEPAAIGLSIRFTIK